MTKAIHILGALVAILFCQALVNNSHAEEGNVPSDQLAQFGLGQMEILSDTEAEEIRGTGFYFFHHGHGRHGYRFNQFRPVAKVLFRHIHGKHGHKHGHHHGKAGFVHAFAFHFLSHKFAHRGYSRFLPVIGFIDGGHHYRR